MTLKTANVIPRGPNSNLSLSNISSITDKRRDGAMGRETRHVRDLERLMIYKKTDGLTNGRNDGRQRHLKVYFLVSFL